MIRISACIEMLFKEYEFNDRPAAAKAAGLEAIEFWGWSNKDLGGLADAANAAGVAVAACGLGTKDAKRAEAIRNYGLLDKRNAGVFAENVQESIEAVRPLGIRTMLTTVGQELDGVPRGDQHEAIVECLKAAAPIAEKEGFTLVLEPLNILVNHKGYYLSSSHEAADILKAVGSPNIKMLFDVYHQQITEGNLIANLTEYMPLIGHIHTADNPGRHEFGTGEINYKAVLRAIDDAGYEGYTGLEYSPTCATGRSLAGVFSALL
ncbi:MAG: TIM barrel protein [Oscillospiraceae bacterium]|nr:TIM barrel protein [Oscillospiraceae bacterium]